MNFPSLKDAVQWLMDKRDKDVAAINTEFLLAKDRFDIIERRLLEIENGNDENQIFSGRG